MGGMCGLNFGVIFFYYFFQEWTMDSEDLGATLGVSVFDCPGTSNLRDGLHLLKRAFLAKNKNYQ